MAQYIMVQGTSSHVGKSIVATALCRIFLQDGKKVVPFKAQNMALNSYVTAEGLEMGRAQVAQAEAAGLLPMVDMNPVLLKPTGNSCSQVIINGRPVGNMSAAAYHQGYSLKAFDAVKAALKRLDTAFDVVVIEGAGSPAEVNLKANDIVNMRVAKAVKAPVLLVADIDRGGSLAAIVGTLELLEPDERDLVKGLIINKFRGDVSLFTPAVDFLEKKTGKPVLGILPYLDDLGIDEEDSVSLADKQHHQGQGGIEIAVIQVPKISNFTDFDSLDRDEQVHVYYVQDRRELGNPDCIILPGSKNTTEDMVWLGQSGLAEQIRQANDQGVPVVGICGGYQMLGQQILDPMQTESTLGQCDGLGLLPLVTTFAPEKRTSQVTGACENLPFMGRNLTVPAVTGYEIHMGQTICDDDAMVHPLHVAGTAVTISTARPDGLVWGTYMHGIFDNDAFRHAFIDALGARKGIHVTADMISFKDAKERSYDRLADMVRHHLDMPKLRQIMAGDAL